MNNFGNVLARLTHFFDHKYNCFCGQFYKQLKARHPAGFKGQLHIEYFVQEKLLELSQCCQAVEGYREHFPENPECISFSPVGGLYAVIGVVCSSTFVTPPTGTALLDIIQMGESMSTVPYWAVELAVTELIDAAM